MGLRRCRMSVVRNPPGGFHRADSNASATENMFCLSDSDRVSDEPAVNKDPRATSSMFVFETNLRGDLSSAQTPNDAVERASTRDDTWSGLDVAQTLGQLMTETRKHLGLSREQVADQTNIPAYYVRMIESD